MISQKVTFMLPSLTFHEYLIPLITAGSWLQHCTLTLAHTWQLSHRSSRDSEVGMLLVSTTASAPQRASRCYLVSIVVCGLFYHSGWQATPGCVPCEICWWLDLNRNADGPIAWVHSICHWHSMVANSKKAQGYDRQCQERGIQAWPAYTWGQWAMHWTAKDF